MATLTNTKIKDTYNGLLKTTDNDALGGTYKLITDGLGNSSGLYLGTGGNVGIGTDSPDTLLHTFGSGNVAKFETTSLGGINLSRENNVGNHSTHYVISFNNSDSEIAYIKTLNKTGGTTNTGTGYEMQFATSGSGYQTFYTNGSEKMRIDSSGNVGIGTTSPSANLHISGTSDVGLRIKSGASSLSYIDFDDADSGTPSGSIAYNNIADAMIFATGGSNTEKMRITSDSNSTLRLGVSGTGSSIFEMKSASGGSSVIDVEQYLQIKTSGSERMRIDSSGNVGIGTSSPSHRLDVTVSDATWAAAIKNTDSTNGYGLFLQSAQSASKGILGAYSGSSYKFYVRGDGNVGIGTSNPATYLSVQTTGSSGSDDIAVFNRSTGEVLKISREASEAVLNASSNLTLSADYDNNNTSASSNVIFKTDATERMRITSGGQLQVGGTAESFNARIVVHRDSYSIESRSTGTGSEGHLVFNNANGAVGSIFTSGSSTAYNTSSDYRLKENVVDMVGALDRVDQLKPCRFNFITDTETTVDGFIAHEVQSVIPEAISGEKDAVDDEGNPEYQGIDQSKIVPLLVGAIKELKSEIETLKSQINS